MYKCKREGINWKMPDGMQSKVNAATIHHIVTNKHHPEYWDDDFDAFTKFNAGNRDCVPNEMVNGTSMPAVSLMEMIADWCAVSEERGTNPMD